MVLNITSANSLSKFALIKHCINYGITVACPNIDSETVDCIIFMLLIIIMNFNYNCNYHVFVHLLM